MNTARQRRRWFRIAGPVVGPGVELPGLKLPPLGFLIEFAALILVCNARPGLAPGLMGMLWPETVDA